MKPFTIKAFGGTGLFQAGSQSRLQSLLFLCIYPVFTRVSGNLSSNLINRNQPIREPARLPRDSATFR